jgi:hypothetical protein
VAQTIANGLEEEIEEKGSRTGDLTGRGERGRHLRDAAHGARRLARLLQVTVSQHTWPEDGRERHGYRQWLHVRAAVLPDTMAHRPYPHTEKSSSLARPQSSSSRSSPLTVSCTLARGGEAARMSLVRQGPEDLGWVTHQ